MSWSKVKAVVTLHSTCGWAKEEEKGAYKKNKKKKSEQS